MRGSGRRNAWARVLATGGIAIFGHAAIAHAQAAPSPVMLVVDVSGSMGDDDGHGTRKIAGAKNALLDYLGKVEAGTPIGLRTYPDQKSGSSCNSGALRFPAKPVDPEEMSAVVRGLSPDGDTPTAEAIRAAAQDLKGYRHGTLVIVSDGESTCDNPCDAAKEVARKGYDLDALTVGFRISDQGRKELQCIAHALSGRYLDVNDSKGLGDALDAASRPRLQVTLSDGPSTTLVAGGEPERLTVSVKNNGEEPASDVVAELSFDPKAPGFDVRRPVTRVGNLDPHAQRSVTWLVRAGPELAGRTVRFDAVAGADNATESGRAQGQAVVEGVTTAAQAGGILKGPGHGIAILGDSYSAGEGADTYFAGTDTERNGCHRSPKTYLAPKFADVSVFACSGDVAAQVTGPNGNGDPAQTESLAKLQDAHGPARAVAMTIGGNDAHFPALAKSCVAGRESCTTHVYYGLPPNAFTNYKSRQDFEEAELGHSRGLGAVLESTYRDVNGILNSETAVSARGRAAPILVLAYPIPVPIEGRKCPQMGAFEHLDETPLGPRLRTHYLLTEQEIDFAVSFALRLNATVEAAVENARRNHGVPVFFVPSTELAFQPRHTVCDSGAAGSASEPFARSLISLNGAGADRDLLLKAASPFEPLLALQRLLGVKRLFELSFQELVHPNVRGYEAETLAIMRWSRSPEAREAEAFTAKAAAVKAVNPSWNSSDVNLGQLGGGAAPTLQGGTTYPLTLDGFAPGTPVEVVAHSAPRVLATPSADASGEISTRVAIPRDLKGGDHTLVASGVDPRGKAREVSIAFKVETEFSLPLPAWIAAGSLFLLLLGMGLLRLSRRRGPSAGAAPAAAVP